MAKRKVRPQPGALLKLLRDKGMTQMDAHTQTGLDRKTLSKINRGEEVKLETLQQMTTKLRVTDAYFLNSAAAADDADVLSVLRPGDIMLRKLSAERLAAILKGASRIRWELNAHVEGETARKSLEEFEEAVEEFRQQLKGNHDTPTDSLRSQLRRLKTAEDITTRLEQLAEHRLAVLGAEYLFWENSSEDDSFYEGRRESNYISFRIVLLSVEPSGTQSRRLRVSRGSVPPRFSDRSRTVFVDGLPLKTEEEGNEEVAF